jgi:hypothetical protein
MGNSKKNISRRSFIQNSLAASASVSPLSIFLGNILSHYIQKSEALAQGLDPQSLMSIFNLYMGGGPARWNFDLPLSPDAEYMDTKNAMLITQYGQGLNGAPGVYKSINIDGTYLPWFWSGKLPTSNGGSVDSMELARKMLVIRGVEQPTDGHSQNAARMLTPIEGTNIPGLLADSSLRPIPSIGLLGSSAFYKSGRGVAHATVGASSNMLISAMAPYVLSSASKTNPGILIEDAPTNIGFPMGVSASQTGDVFDHFFQTMAANSGALHRYLPTTYQDRVKAKQLLKGQFGDLKATYNTLFSKYQSLIDRALFSSEAALQISGIDDSPLPGNKDNPHWRISVQGGGATYAGDPIYSGTDLRSCFDNTHGGALIPNLASCFVLAEFMLKNKLSQSVYGIVSGIKNLKLDQIHYLNNGILTPLVNQIYDYTLDHHFDGASVPLLMNSRYFKAVAACLYELMSVLQAENLFNNTMFNMLSEFSRSTLSNGVGTGHGYKGAVFSCFSGKVQRPTVIGNIGPEMNQAGPITSHGYWGAAAPLESMGGRKLNPGNVASTVAAIVGVPSPSPNNIALVKVEGDVIVPLITEKTNKT